MAIPVVIPNQFATATASIPLSQLDANFNTLSNAINGLANGSETLANISVTDAIIGQANITSAIIDNFSSSNVTITGGSLDNIALSNVNISGETLDNVTLTNVIITSGNVNATNVVCTTANATTGNITTVNATTGNITTVNATTLDTTNIEVTNIKAKDGTASVAIADSTGAVTVSTLLNVDNLRLDGNTISSTNSNGNIVLEPNGTGDVYVDADTLRVGDVNAAATVTTNGTGNLTISTNNGTNSGTLVINQGTNGNIAITPNGTGEVDISKVDIDGGTIDATTIGGSTRAAGNFTTLDANGNVTLGDATSDTITATGRFNTDLVPSTDNARDLGTSALKWKQVYATTFTEGTFPVVIQTDIGSAPNEIPLNQYLGALAYEDTETPALDVGTGITTGTGTICKANGGLMGGIYQMTILIDLTGLNSGGTAGDIIGVDGTALPCYIARLPAMTVLGGRMTCLETPAGGDTDIDLYSATEGTGVEDQAITALTETEIINAGTQSAGTVTYFSADPAANAYFYLVGQSTSNATYTAGRFLIEIFGVQ